MRSDDALWRHQPLRGGNAREGEACSGEPATSYHTLDGSDSASAVTPDVKAKTTTAATTTPTYSHQRVRPHNAPPIPIVYLYLPNLFLPATLWVAVGRRLLDHWMQSKEIDLIVMLGQYARIYA